MMDPTSDESTRGNLRVSSRELARFISEMSGEMGLLAYRAKWPEVALLFWQKSKKKLNKSKCLSAEGYRLVNIAHDRFQKQPSIDGRDDPHRPHPEVLRPPRRKISPDDPAEKGSHPRSDGPGDLGLLPIAHDRFSCILPEGGKRQ